MSIKTNDSTNDSTNDNIVKPPAKRKPNRLRRPKGYVTTFGIQDKYSIDRKILLQLIRTEGFPKRLAWSKKPFLFCEKEVAKYFGEKV